LESVEPEFLRGAEPSKIKFVLQANEGFQDKRHAVHVAVAVDVRHDHARLAQPEKLGTNFAFQVGGPDQPRRRTEHELARGPKVAIRRNHGGDGRRGAERNLVAQNQMQAEAPLRIGTRKGDCALKVRGPRHDCGAGEDPGLEAADGPVNGVRRKAEIVGVDDEAVHGE
jgi:hypothetical protein